MENIVIVSTLFVAVSTGTALALSSLERLRQQHAAIARRLGARS
jgi:hypothetical protein